MSTSQITESKNSEAAASKESLYRTQWLMAHNRLYDLAHDPAASVADSWIEYLKELNSAVAAARIPA